MSTAVFPALAGQTWDITRTPMWSTTIQKNQSGKEVRMGNYTYPLWQWDVVFAGLRQGTVHGTAYTELAQLAGFYNSRQGSFDSFLYTDGDDNSVTGQNIGTGDGATLAFQLIRTFGGFIEPVLAPHTVAAVYVDGVLKTVTTDYTVSSWGSANPGVVTFTSAPAAGKAVTVDYTYYWPVRFLTDNIPFNKLISNIYEGKKISFISVKN